MPVNINLAVSITVIFHQLIQYNLTHLRSLFNYPLIHHAFIIFLNISFIAAHIDAASGMTWTFFTILFDSGNQEVRQGGKQQNCKDNNIGVLYDSLNPEIKRILIKDVLSIIQIFSILSLFSRLDVSSISTQIIPIFF
jgi:hypothetical protein